LENTLNSKGISKDFDEWIAIAKDRSKWRQLTHSIPKPPDAWRLKDTSRENDYNCITQKNTQPSQTCSEGYIFETGPEGPELEDSQVEKKSKAAQTRPAN